jgi:hypothetical protein
VTPDDDDEKSEFAPIIFLPELTFEMPFDKSVRYGRAETPVHILPSLEVKMTE